MPHVLYCPSCGKPMTLAQGPLPACLECPHCHHRFSPNIPAATPVVPPPLAKPIGEVSPKSRLLAGLLGIVFGWLGIHRFYLGYWGIGILQILVSVISAVLAVKLRSFNLGVVWGLFEGILILAGKMRDARGRPVLSS